jgi:hypothetical protein
VAWRSVACRPVDRSIIPRTDNPCGNQFRAAVRGVYKPGAGYIKPGGGAGYIKPGARDPTYPRPPKHPLGLRSSHIHTILHIIPPTKYSTHPPTPLFLLGFLATVRLARTPRLWYLDAFCPGGYYCCSFLRELIGSGFSPRKLGGASLSLSWCPFTSVRLCCYTGVLLPQTGRCALCLL